MIGRIIFIILLISGALGIIFNFSIDILSKLFEIFMWLSMLNYSSPDISFLGVVVVNTLTAFLTYTLIGKIFSSLNVFDRDGMKIGYFIISTIMSFLFTHLIWYFEKYIKLILIGLVLVSVITIGCIFINYLRRKSKCQKEK